MNRKWKIGIYSGTGVIILTITAALVWGATWRMDLANRDFREGRTDKAATVYQEMAVDQPRSPYVLHNVGLATYRKEQYSKAMDLLGKAVGNAADQKNLAAADLFKIYYHSGDAAFKAASSGGPNAINLYQEALQFYKKAIEADPKDWDAKYNYELACLRAKESQQRQQQDQNQNQGKNPDSKNGKDSGKDHQNQSPNRDQTSGKNNQPQAKNGFQNPQNKQSGNGTQPKNGQMTRQEAEALLQMAEHGDQFQAPVVKGDAGNPEKDW